jgi:hypothetical protein
MKLKIIFFLCALFLIVFWTNGSLQASAIDSIPKKSLSFTFNRFFLKDTIKFVECTLANNTDSTFWILAYDTTRLQGNIYIHPTYSMQVKKNGEWKDGGLGFSGMGLQIYTFKPGQKLIFETPDFDTTSQAIKIGITIRLNEDNLRASREIWTEEIRLR